MKKDLLGFFGFLWLTGISAVALVWAVGWICTPQWDATQRAAIKSGHAEYVADESGRPVFRWKEVEVEQ